MSRVLMQRQARHQRHQADHQVRHLQRPAGHRQVFQAVVVRSVTGTVTFTLCVPIPRLVGVMNTMQVALLQVLVPVSQRRLAW